MGKKKNIFIYIRFALFFIRLFFFALLPLPSFALLRIEQATFYQTQTFYITHAWLSEVTPSSLLFGMLSLQLRFASLHSVSANRKPSFRFVFVPSDSHASFICNSIAFFFCFFLFYFILLFIYLC